VAALAWCGLVGDVSSVSLCADTAVGECGKENVVGERVANLRGESDDARAVCALLFVPVSLLRVAVCGCVSDGRRSE
jgi:hypothetical protein